MNYLGAKSRFSRTLLRCLVLVATLWGATSSVEMVFAVADITMGMMSVINLGALILLSDAVIKVTYDYFHQRKVSAAPEFHLERLPEIRGTVDHTIWSPQRA